MTTEDNNWQESFSVRMQSIDNQSKKKRRLSIEDIEWQDLYSVDIESIDNHHKKIVALINDLESALRSNSVNYIFLADLIDKLIHYSKYHFSYEEMFFLKFQYAEGDAHKRKHQDFVQKLNSFKNGLNVELAPEIASFLRTWFTDHIIGTDKKYSNLFKANGVT